MIIRFATQNDTETLKNIWFKTFSDTKEFVDWNFKYNYKSENVMLCEDKGVICSALHLIPYEVILDAAKLKGTYISAVATVEEFRGKNYASSLISSALEHLKERGDDIAFLVPAINGFYEKFGFETVLVKNEILLPYKKVTSSTENFLTNPSPCDALSIYNKINKTKKFYLSRTISDMSLILDDLFKNTCGDLKILSDRSGYVIYKESDECIELYEIMAKNSETEKRLFNYLYSLEGNIKFTLPPVMIKMLNKNGTYPKDISRKNAYFNLIL